MKIKEGKGLQKNKLRLKKQNIIVLYEDKDIVAVNKPAGLLVHSDGRSKDKTLVDWFTLKYPRSKNIGEDIVLANGEVIKRSGVVHRLDKDTSGVILMAKTKVGFEHLKKQFQEHSIKKIYNAFVYGVPKIKRGIIDRAIGRDKNDFRKKTTERSMKGEVRNAETNYIVKEWNDKYSFVTAIPKTGRTHQIRVHFKSIGYPIVGDSLYSLKNKNTLGLKRTALHSSSIEFENSEGHRLKVESSFPEDFALALELLRK
jgi:23S rRNA pseudouridine1911/1915/1917 synthase